MLQIFNDNYRYIVVRFRIPFVIIAVDAIHGFEVWRLPFLLTKYK